jgi:hypothetical protein
VVLVVPQTVTVIRVVRNLTPDNCVASAELRAPDAAIRPMG